MTLREALLIEKGITAIVGGGGKTTLMMRLSKELSSFGSVIVCTTTHILVPEGIEFYLGANKETVREALKKQSVISLGEREAETGKLVAPKLSMKTLKEISDYVLVEADGSKRLPLKAHAAHEPPIPREVNRILYVVGADGMGKTVREAAHRPELYAKIIGKSMEDIVTPEDAAFAASTIKNAVAVVNKVESEQALCDARRFAKTYEGRVAICSLKSEQPLIELWENKSRLW
ncbi:MAG TPA: selenium cofactor biosynthesis protein YqeC [Clostridia bacterium]|nr:selenium cofactor biosynthesis protein YqeC [Clostridia bacterium]